jgi:type I restriction enzyme S subunit
VTTVKRIEIDETKLPDGWEASTLKCIASYIQRGKSPKYTELSELPVINQKCVRWNGIDREFVKYIHPEQFEKWDEVRFLQSGDLLWNSTGTGTIGRAAIVQLQDGERLVADSHVTIVRSAEGMEPKYVHYWVMGPAVQNSIEAMQSGSTNQVELSKGAVESTPIPVAPPEQQKRIVAKIEELFSHIDAGIAALNKTKKLLKQYRQSVLKAAVTGELTKQWREENKDKLEPASQLLERILIERREKWEAQQLAQFEVKGKIPKDDKWKDKYKETAKYYDAGLFEIPEMWCWAYLGQLGHVTGGLTKNKKRESFELQLPYLRVANVYANELRLDEVKDIGIQESELDRVLLEEGDLLVVEGNGSPDQIGRLAIWDGSINPCVHQNHLIKVRLPEKDSGSFIMHWLSSIGGRGAILEVASSTTGLYTLSISKVEGLPVPIPSLAEMKKIGELVEEKLVSIERLTVEIDRQLLKAEKSKQSILASAFSGRLVERGDADGDTNDLLQKIEKQNVLNDAKQKLTKRKPTVKKVKGMPKRKILDVLKESSESVAVDKLFEASGYSDDLSSENIERFYSELKSVVALNEVKVCPISENDKKQEDRIFYKAL